MKLERMIRKAAPFLLIAILIACLFSKPQKEGMKAINHEIHDELHYGKKVIQSPKYDVKAHMTTGMGSSMAGGDNEWYDWVTPPKSRMDKALEKYEKLPERDEMNDEFGDPDEFVNKFEELPERDEMNDEFGDFDAFKKFEELPEREGSDTVLDHMPEDTSSSPAEFEPSAASEPSAAFETPAAFENQAMEFRANNAKVDEEGVRDAEDPKDFIRDVGEDPAADSEFVVEHPYDFAD